MPAELKPEDLAAFVGGADYGEVFVESSESRSLKWEDGKLADAAASKDRGLSLRYLRRRAQGVETLLASDQTPSLEALATLRRRLLGLPPASSPAPLKSSASSETIALVDPFGVPLPDKIALFSSIDRALRSEFPSIRQVSLFYSERRRRVAIANSEGASLGDSRLGVMLAIHVVSSRDGVLQTGSEIIGGPRGYELLLESQPLRIARRAARRAELKLAAPKAAAGEMPVVLSSAAGGTFIHEAIGHSLEADHVQEGTSPAYHGKRGQAIACEKIKVIDDPTLPYARGSFRFDDEGITAAPTVLVKNGVLADYLYDRSTAFKENRASNGHGRRESYACSPIPRMSNLYIAPGPDDPRRIIQSLDSGILVTRMGGGQVNTATGRFVFEVDEGFLVKDGVVRHMVRDANLLGVGPEILRSIDLVGWDIGWGIGTCGKDGQGVPVSDGQPTLRIPKALVGGKNE